MRNIGMLRKELCIHFTFFKHKKCGDPFWCKITYLIIHNFNIGLIMWIIDIVICKFSVGSQWYTTITTHKGDVFIVGKQNRQLQVHRICIKQACLRLRVWRSICFFDGIMPIDRININMESTWNISASEVSCRNMYGLGKIYSENESINYLPTFFCICQTISYV